MLKKELIYFNGWFTMTTERSTVHKNKQKRVRGTMIGFDLKNNDSHTGIKDIHHAVGRTSRSVSEAFKDANYATPIWKCSSDFDRAIYFLAQAGAGFFQVGFVIGVLILLAYWIFR